MSLSLFNLKWIIFINLMFWITIKIALGKLLKYQSLGWFFFLLQINQIQRITKVWGRCSSHPKGYYDFSSLKSTHFDDFLGLAFYKSMYILFLFLFPLDGRTVEFISIDLCNGTPLKILIILVIPYPNLFLFLIKSL